jgi:hypothetical protein
VGAGLRHLDGEGRVRLSYRHIFEDGDGELELELLLVVCLESLSIGVGEGNEFPYKNAVTESLSSIIVFCASRGGRVPLSNIERSEIRSTR